MTVAHGWIDLSSRGRILVSGSEAVMFLNGLVSNDMKTLAANSWMLAAFPQRARSFARSRPHHSIAQMDFLASTPKRRRSRRSCSCSIDSRWLVTFE